MLNLLQDCLRSTLWRVLDRLGCSLEDSTRALDYLRLCDCCRRDGDHLDGVGSNHGFCNRGGRDGKGRDDRGGAGCAVDNGDGWLGGRDDGRAADDFVGGGGDRCGGLGMQGAYGDEARNCAAAHGLRASRRHEENTGDRVADDRLSDV